MTPIRHIESFLKALSEDEPVFTQYRKILDPCAGGDDAHLMSYPTAIANLYPDIKQDILTIDIRKDSLAEIKEDYLTYALEDKPDVIITNPPFNMALPIIEKALEDVNDGGYVIMLLRLNFFGSKARFPFFENNMPKRCYVHHERMGFTERGGTDSIEYMHAVWQKGSSCTAALLRVI